MGTMGSRSLQVGGSAVLNATRRGARQGQADRRARCSRPPRRTSTSCPARGLGVTGSPDASVSWAELAEAAVDATTCPRASSRAWPPRTDFATPDSTYPFGAHLAVVEVDTETGLTSSCATSRSTTPGRILNPLLVEGQVHGGIAQGAAQALFEEIAFDEDGNRVDRLARVLRDPVGERPAELRDRAHADAEPAQPARRQGHRRVGHDRLDPGDLERRRRRRVAPRRQQHRHARAPRSASGRRSRTPGRPTEPLPSDAVAPVPRGVAGRTPRGCGRNFSRCAAFCDVWTSRTCSKASG